MKFKTNFLKNYLIEAPIPLAIERFLECNILSKKEFDHPILDIGCGEGLFAYILFNEKIDVGLDPNNRELDRAHVYDVYDELLNCYGDRIPKENESFKTIFSNSVMEHIDDITPVLKEANRLLMNDGRLYLTLPTNLFDKYSVVYQLLTKIKLNHLAEIYRKFYNQFWNHYHYHDKNGWEKLFNECDFAIIEYEEYSSNIITTLNDFLVPFSILGFFNKKIFNKWVLFKSFRRIYMWPFNIILRSIINAFESNKDGGIIFFSLKKKHN